MTRATRPANPIADLLEGERDATKALAQIASGAAAPDLLLHAIAAVLASDGVLAPPTTRLRGFARRLQKALEQSAPMPMSGRQEASA
ncbi:MAG: hypothetical protein QM766_27525 [Burkholderiaceae bacterium]